MANAKHETVIAHGIFVLMAIVYMFRHQGVKGGPVLGEKYPYLKHKGTVKTIVSKEDVIDCVDFYQQPAFDDPLIRNNIQMMPNPYPSGMQSNNSTRPKLTQPWHKHGECPKGTISIRRSSRQDNHKAFQFQESNPDEREYAEASVDIGQYYGAQAKINVWNPKTEADDFSLSQLWVTSKASSGALSTIEAGWIVYPVRYGDFATRFFIYWTDDNYQTTGCYDLDCDGFVQTDTSFSIGSPIVPVSVYGWETFEISISINKVPHGDRWWLEVDGKVIGYWPDNIFTGRLATYATEITWGGEILYHPSPSTSRHTTTHMGSGHFPSEGYGKSSYFNTMKVVDVSGYLKYPHRIIPFVTNHACYDLQLDPSEVPKYFYYGGPGYSANCP